jgi:hypothetical protein
LVVPMPPWFLLLLLTMWSQGFGSSLVWLWLYDFSSMHERCTVMSVREPLQNWMSFLRVLCCSIDCGVPETCHSPERWLQFHWLENASFVSFPGLMFPS